MLPVQVLNSNPALGAVIVSSCVIIATFVVLSLFISIILMAVTEERENHQVTFTFYFDNYSSRHLKGIKFVLIEEGFV